ncbi:hypothetical protein PUNSTDRAFT_126939 [Punctularia strigosozonata HHB-11173 SS5]|uniref:uncharacterized protein n=1 Tax=Punctularia strigosozonata (strain HHB-11173) TaxID=741275 RepID=UPI0004417CA3|nr:uncharacterized protein PUNSTDRAFT_126939 [Punctularia strigosozonata HHB-11173 SS5]EIN07077.1 hypothetical protein PUNSTDRAFT_126939 [Punctularia strigosozonata HHB-11173 SS5]
MRLPSAYANAAAGDRWKRAPCLRYHEAFRSRSDHHGSRRHHRAIMQPVQQDANLEKERGIVRTIPLNERPSCIAFAPDGSAILLGTHDGRLLVQNLRALDKPPTSTSLGDTVPVVAICVQGKARAPPKTVDRKPTSTLASPAPRRASAPHAKSPRPSTSRTSSAAVAKSPLARRGAPSSSQSPLTARLAASVSKGSTGTPITPVRSRKATEPVSKSPQVLFPVKDIGNANARATSTSAKTGKAVRPALKGTAKKENESTTPRSPPPSGLVATKGKPADARARATSSASARDRIRPSGSSSSTASKSSGRGTVREREPPPPVPPIPSAHRIEAAPPQHRRTRSAVSSASTRTPSPDLPSPSDDPVTPLPAGRAKKMSLGVLGLGSPPDPDTEKGKERAKAEADGADGAVRVGFADDSDEDGDADDGDDVVVVGAPPQRETSMQISPRPPRASVPHWAVPSPLRNSHGPNGLPIPSPSRPGLPSGAQELLRSIVQDVMLDFRQETRAEMMGLHLDLVRMGRGWKSELREALGGVGEEMERLREENRVLREENERLKRGY